MSWYYAEDGTQMGPVTEEEFQSLVASGRIRPDTLVWREGMPDWQAYGEIADSPVAYGESTPPSVENGGGAISLEPVPLTFTGKFEEYFKIWIVNLLLTIVTLGIYAAWAKVRTKRYFHSNTQLMGHPFAFLANPVRILIGNLIVVGLYFGFSFGGVVSPMLSLAFLLVFLVAVPWFIVRAFKFNARNSGWRGLRFQFHGGYGMALFMYVLLPFVSAFTMWLLYPLVAKMRKEWVMSQHAFGRTRFSFTGTTEDAYKIYLTTLLFFLPLIGCYFFFIVTAVVSGGNGGEPPAAVLFSFLLFIPAALLSMIGGIFLRARMFNYTWGNTQLGLHCFEASMSARKLIGIQVVNWIVTFLTLGLMQPWAAVRVAEYAVSCLRFIPGGSVDDFVAAEQENVTAVGDAAADFFDLDIGISFGL